MSVAIRTGFDSWSQVDVSLFRSGELNVKLPFDCDGDDIDVLFIATTHHSLIELALTVDAIKQSGGLLVNLCMPYMPYARQDRVCNPGEALSCKVAADIINSCEFEAVYSIDPHSDVMPALIDNFFAIPIEDIVSQIELNLYDALVAPDAGSAKKVFALCEEFGLEFVQGFKHRDTETGALTGFEYIGDVSGKNLLIVDDICEGGGTFVGLSERLRDGGANLIDLYVTHGIFSRGTNLDNIDKIFTTNSRGTHLVSKPGICVFDVLSTQTNDYSEGE